MGVGRIGGSGGSRVMSSGLVAGSRRMSSGTVTRPHNCMSPGCTRRGETERGYNRDVTRPHNCMSPGCTRRGETETVSEFIPKQRVTETTYKATIKKPLAPDPDPFRFEITKSYSEGGFTLVRITYFGCTNYEGEKILLLRKDIGSIVALDHLDPHFLETDENGLLARFIPTDAGWELGLGALKSLL